MIGDEIKFRKEGNGFGIMEKNSRKKTGKINQLAGILRQDFSNSLLKDGERVASAREIADRFKISIPTAHEVINQLVREGMLFRVRGSGTFIRRRKDHRSLRIALLDTPAMPVPKSLYDVFVSQINHIYDLLCSRNYQVQVISYFDLREPRSALDLLRSFDGLMVANTYVDDYTLPLLQKCGIPFVVFHHNYQIDRPFCQVFGDMTIGMEEALELVSPGRLNQAIVFTEHTPTGDALTRQWLAALKNRGIESGQVKTVTIDLTRRSSECYKYIRVYGKAAAEGIILTATDGLAYNLINAFMLENYQPGKDFHLISCGNREAQGFRFADEPMITSIGVSEEQTINETVKLLLRLIDEPSDCIYHIRIPSRLVIRKSFTGQNQ